jgi:hypothetical protein
VIPARIAIEASLEAAIRCRDSRAESLVNPYVLEDAGRVKAVRASVEEASRRVAELRERLAELS